MSKQNFIEACHELIRLVPPGRVTTYGAIARALGTGKSSRLVGMACILGHGSEIPIHRVVNRQGLLTGKQHYETPMRMQELLEREGIEIEDNKVCHFDRHFWDPALEIS